MIMDANFKNKLTAIANKTIKKYYGPLPIQDALVCFNKTSNLFEIHTMIYNTVYSEELLGNIEWNENISGNLKKQLIEAFYNEIRDAHNTERNKYIPPTDKELLEFLQEGER